MRLLLDTHVLLWFITGDSRLSARHRDAVRDRENEVFVSVASVWECVIKHALGNLPLPGPPAEYLPRERVAHQFESLAIDEPTMSRLATLPPLHRDPFDRILVAQALEHDLHLLTVDHQIMQYAVRVLEAK